ncbi:hypothetical protein V492_07500, partial [Pseudogymnoascus sp. VKM F-4246]
MRNINTQRKADGKEPQEPWQYFDLMGGTSTGGIIAIMLGRLRMTTDECIDAYTQLSKTIFTPKHSRRSPARPVNFVNGDEKFDSKAFEGEIKTQIKNSKVANEDDQILLRDANSTCGVCVVALHEENSAPAIFRTYDYTHASHTLFDECKVWEACRATSAAPTFFDPIQIGRFKQSFIDGGLGFNNPIFQVYQEAQNMWPDRTIIVTSIGTGEVPGAKFGGNLKKIAKSIKEMVTDCDKVANVFYKANKTMADEGHYFRFSVTHGLGDIGLEEYKNIPVIASRTQTYLATGEPEVKLRRCVEALLQELEHGNSISLLNSDSVQAPSSSVTADDSATIDDSDLLQCLESLKFEGMNFREGNIVSADHDTCEWLLQDENYSRWIRDDNGILWIQGKAGAGKSTLMKYIYKRIEGPTADASSLKLSFFFHARGTELQKSTLGMFKSLLLQLYKRDLTARREIKKEFDKASEDIMANLKLEWTEDMVRELFSSVICHISGSKKNITIFVDALDEAGVAANTLAIYLVSLYDKVRQSNRAVKICFSCRHYPIVSAKVTDDQKVILELKNEPGIRSFLKNEFKKSKVEEIDGELKDDIAKKANGLFQWVCLVLPMIFDAYKTAKPPVYIQKMLHMLPEGLNNMYQYILRDLIHQEQPAEILKLFRWVYFAARPLSVQEIQHALAVVDKLPQCRVYNLKSSAEYVEDRVETRITALSGGLVEVRAHGSETILQFTHQTVRDFLLEKGFEILAGSEYPANKEKQQFEGSCHDILARSCINYLWAEDVQQHSTATDVKGSSSKRSWIQLPTSETLPLLQYAVAALFWHASKAEQYECCQNKLLEQLDYKYTSKFLKDHSLEEGIFSLWRSAGEIYCAREYFGVLPSAGSTLLHIASMANIHSAVNILLKKGAQVDEKDQRGQQAIHYAARGGATEVSRILIKISRSVINAEDNNSITPLQMAARHYRSNTLRLLITKGAKIKYFKKTHPWKADKICFGIEKTIQLLIEDAAELNAQSLQSAAASGNLETVQLLLAEGTDVNIQSGGYGSALVAAAYNGHNAVADALLQKGAEINSQGGIYGCALVAAATSGLDEMVRILLQAGAEIDAKGGEHPSALAAAIDRGHVRVIKILLGEGAKINSQSGKFGNILAIAASKGHTDIVRILLAGGANINAQGGEYGNALVAAICNGHIEMSMILLEGGANINAQGGEHGNALVAAICNGHIEM